MRIVVNGEAKVVPDDATIPDVLSLLDVPADGRGVAVAIEAEVVPRGAWSRRALREGERVEVLHAVQGG